MQTCTKIVFVDEITDGHCQFQSSYEESCLREKKEPSTGSNSFAYRKGK